jgi:hypothetical protein
VQLITELQYSIEVLKSTSLDWTEDEIQMMMDYYTLQGDLIAFGFRAIVFDTLCITPHDQVWATVQQLNTVENNSTVYDAYLLQLITDLDIAYQAGDVNLQVQIDNILSGTNAITAELTTEVTVGGVYEGTVYPIGTLIETIIADILAQPVVASNFTFDSFAEVIEVGVNLTITQFTWDMVGTPINLRIADSKGINDVAVTGGVHNISWGYNWSIAEDITWTLSADNMDDISVTVKRRSKTYYGKEATADDTLVTITEAKVLAGISTLQENSEEVTVTADTANSEQGFIAVHKAEHGADYTKWFVDNTNFSDILVGEFINPPVDVLVSGKTYRVYRWGYRSPLTNDIKLHR